MKRTTLLIFLGFFTATYAQNVNILRGKVYSAATKKTVDFATVISLEPVRAKAYTDEQGFFELRVPRAGVYSIFIRSSGYQDRRESITINGVVTRDFVLKLAVIRARKITVYADKEKQKLSRHTMTFTEIKDTPGAFGDALAALATLPGITKRGFVGPLIIRGARGNLNQYLIDDIPIQSPQHLLGLHAIISTNLMDEIDVYSSAAPALYGFSAAATIDITTRDQVKDLGGFADVGLISANALIERPIYDSDHEPTGYAIVAARAGYLPLIFPIIDLLAGPGSPLQSAPQYYDYQAKFKYFLGKDHAIKLFLLGYYDEIKINDSAAALAERNKDKVTQDPLLVFNKLHANKGGHYQAVYYEYQPSVKFSNRLLAFSSLNLTDFDFVFTADNKTEEGQNNTQPNIFGLKEKFRFNWLGENALLRMGAEYRLYDFHTKGKELIILKPNPFGFFDPADSSSYALEPYERSAQNHVVTGYIENKFQFWGITLKPGARVEYLHLNKETQINPRGLIAYDFLDDYTVSVAGGRYTNFLQTNPNHFDFDSQVATLPDYKSEKAYHLAAGIEKQFAGDLKIRIEGFYNYFFDLSHPYSDPSNTAADGGTLTRINSGTTKAYGAEFFIKKSPGDRGGFYGQLGYTFTQSKEKTGIPNQEFKDTFINTDEEQKHSIESVFGYRWNGHTLSSHVAFQSSFPYTKITGDDGDPTMTNRYGRVFSTHENTEHFEPILQIDLRYSFREDHSWGYVTWYVELIGIQAVFYKPTAVQQWLYNQPFAEGTNPEVKASDNALPFFPNFGVEIHF